MTAVASSSISLGDDELDLTAPQQSRIVHPPPPLHWTAETEIPLDTTTPGHTWTYTTRHIHGKYSLPPSSDISCAKHSLRVYRTQRTGSRFPTHLTLLITTLAQYLVASRQISPVSTASLLDNLHGRKRGVYGKEERTHGGW